jgi:hypothetical protein
MFLHTFAKNPISESQASGVIVQGLVHCALKPHITFYISPKTSDPCGPHSSINQSKTVSNALRDDHLLSPLKPYNNEAPNPSTQRCMLIWEQKFNILTCFCL